MTDTISQVRRSLEVEMRGHEREIAKLRKAIAALAPLDSNSRSKGIRVSRRQTRMRCQFPGCSTGFLAKRKDAKFCPGCRGKAKVKLSRDARAAKGAKPRGRTLLKNTPTK